jgi:hypothetical protein
MFVLSLRILFVAAITLMSTHKVCAQEIEKPLTGTVAQRFIKSWSDKARKSVRSLQQIEKKFIKKIDRREAAALRKLARRDPDYARRLKIQCDSLKLLVLHDTNSKKLASGYDGHIDTIQQAIAFLDTNARRAISPSVDKWKGAWKNHLATRQSIVSRRQLLEKALQDNGLSKQADRIGKEAFYFEEGAKAIEEKLSVADHWETKALEALRNSNAFRNFFRSNSELAGLFPAPPVSANGNTQLPGLQTRNSINALLTRQFGASRAATQALREQVSSAQQQLREIQNKLLQLKSGSINTGGDNPLPSRYKLNAQKSKSFIQRLEYGFNIQTVKAAHSFPASGNLGLSLGYKISDGGSVGIGAAFKLGLGHGWDHIRLSGEGVGLRSYAEQKLKGKIFLAGGYEWNYQQSLASLASLPGISKWQQSGLIGLSKKYQAGKKIKGSMQLLWDFLSYQQVPHAQPIVFRIGYALK